MAIISVFLYIIFLSDSVLAEKNSNKHKRQFEDTLYRQDMMKISNAFHLCYFCPVGVKFVTAVSVLITIFKPLYFFP